MYRYERRVHQMVRDGDSVSVNCKHFGEGMISINEIILVPRVYQKAIRMYDRDNLEGIELEHFLEHARIKVTQQLAKEFAHSIKYKYDDYNDTYCFRLSVMEDKERKEFERKIEELSHSLMCHRSTIKSYVAMESQLQRRIKYHIGVEESLKLQLKRPHHLLYTYYKRLFRQYKSKILSMFN